MSRLCEYLGIHNYSPARAFITTLVTSYGPEGEVVGYEESYTGFECTRCKKRKLQKRKNRYNPAPGITNQAYDWVNSVSSRAEVLKLVKND